MTVLGLMGIIAGIIAALVVLLGLFYRMAQWIQRISQGIDAIPGIHASVNNLQVSVAGIETSVAVLKTSVDILMLTNEDRIFDFYHRNSPPSPGNPYTVKERDSLLLKLQENTITRAEALRLQEIMEEEKTTASDKGLSPLTVLGIAGVLLLVALFLGTRDEG